MKYMESLKNQYDEVTEELNTLLDNMKALSTDLINASESDNLSNKDSEELDSMYLTVDSAIKSIEEVAQAMAR